MTGFLSVCEIVADFLHLNLECSEELLGRIFRLVVPLHAESYHLSKYRLATDGIAVRYRDAVNISHLNTIIIYPRVISSADGFPQISSFSGVSEQSPILMAALVQVKILLKKNTAPGDVWRVWVTLTANEDSVFLYLTLSDPFARSDHSFRFDCIACCFNAIEPGLHAHGKNFQLSKGEFFVDGQRSETKGDFIYNFISRVVSFGPGNFFYAEAGHLVLITVDHENKSAAARNFQVEGNPTVMNIFPWNSNSLGMLISKNGKFQIRILTADYREIILPSLPELKVLGAAVDNEMKIHLVPVDTPEVILLSPDFH